jgi:hypothetical protein
MSKIKGKRKSEEKEGELRTHAGIGRTRSLWNENHHHGKNGKGSGKPNMQDRSVHGAELHHAEDHGKEVFSGHQEAVFVPRTSIVTGMSMLPPV